MEPVPTGSTTDGTTRYLCAAAHLDEKFCNAAIAEFLAEPVRAIPPSPGVDSAAVLREAVAAQTRRRIRDALLLVLLLALALVNVTAAISWTLVGVIAAGLLVICQRIVTGATGRPAAGAGRSRLIVALLVLAFFAALSAAPFLFVRLVGFAPDSELGEAIAADLLPTWPTLLVAALLLVVLCADEITVAKLMNSSFQRSHFDPDARRAPSEWERLARSLGHGSRRAGLDRVARSDESSQPAGQADVIVYRGYTPFVGAGVKVEHHVIALPLEPSDDENDPAPIGVNDLHHHVVECLVALRSPSSLGPGRRLEQLRHREQVLIPADRLLFNRSPQTELPVLPDLHYPPLAHLPLGVAREVAEDPLEWARYYSCFRVESWDRDLTTSCYLHIGTDPHMLYLEWTYCVLFPVSQRYRSIDRVRESLGTPLGQALVEWAVLPVSVIQRLRSVFHRHDPLRQRSGKVVPDRYGAARSLRELAADTETQTYFQETDVKRYISIIDRTLLRAVGQFLAAAGYSVAEFTKMADSVVNTVLTGDVANPVVGGRTRPG